MSSKLIKLKEQIKNLKIENKELKKQNKKLEKQCEKKPKSPKSSSTQYNKNDLELYIDNFFKNSSHKKISKFSSKLKKDLKTEAMRFFNNLFRQIEKAQKQKLLEFNYNTSIFGSGINKEYDHFNFKVVIDKDLFKFKDEESKQKFLKMLDKELLIDSNGYAILELFLFKNDLTSHDENVFGVKNSKDKIIYYVEFGLDIE